MVSSQLISPILAMMILTLIVWLYMYITRTRYIISNRVSLHKVNSPEKLAQVIPETINRPANNFKNLFELPVLFYVLMIINLIIDPSSSLILSLAWGYVALRCLHSAIHCTYNDVKQRFIVYVLSSLVLFSILLITLTKWML